MARGRWFALTGTPGTGKSAAAAALRGRGVDVLDGTGLAAAARAIRGIDRRRRSKIVDLARVGTYIRALRIDGPALIDAHWAHEVPGVTAAIVLRTRPRVLRARLERRGWTASKVAENVEAEGMGLILSECAMRLAARRIAEVDTTRASSSTVARRLLPFLERADSRLTNLEIGRVDWTPDFSEWSSIATAASSTRSSTRGRTSCGRSTRTP